MSRLRTRRHVLAKRLDSPSEDDPDICSLRVLLSSLIPAFKRFDYLQRKRGHSTEWPRFHLSSIFDCISLLFHPLVHISGWLIRDRIKKEGQHDPGNQVDLMLPQLCRLEARARCWAAPSRKFARHIQKELDLYFFLYLGITHCWNSRAGCDLTTPDIVVSMRFPDVLSGYVWTSLPVLITGLSKTSIDLGFGPHETWTSFATKLDLGFRYSGQVSVLDLVCHILVWSVGPRYLTDSGPRATRTGLFVTGLVTLCR